MEIEPGSARDRCSRCGGWISMGHARGSDCRATTNAIPDRKTVSLGEMTDLLARSPAGPYGFIVSQQVYDELERQIPKSFEGGNSLAGTPIVVDPDLTPEAVDVAFTAKGWRDRLKQIADRSNSIKSSEGK